MSLPYMEFYNFRGMATWPELRQRAALGHKSLVIEAISQKQLITMILENHFSFFCLLSGLSI